MRENVRASFLQARDVLDRFLARDENLVAVERLSRLFAETFRADRRVFSCGNGGSTCDAMHFAEELTGRYRKERRALPAMALTDVSHITCTGNDYGFDHIFSRAVEAHAREGDVLLVLSTSGNSGNLVKAVEKAREQKVTTVALLGRDGGKLKTMVDIPLVIEANLSDRIQEMHIKIIHIAIEMVERELFPELYAS